jgi:DNA-binding CsgD family transcriptional regulator
MQNGMAKLELPYCLGPANLWNALEGDPLTSVILATVSGKVMYANARASQFLIAPNADPSVLMNHTLETALPKPASRQYLDAIAKAQSTDSPVLLREIWQGRQMLTRFLFVRCEQCDDPEVADGGVIAVGRRVEGAIGDSLGAAQAAEVVTANYVNLGPLDILSDREIEVLSLLCTGLTAKEIAKKLDRSFKTVENHRYVIGRKLGATDRHALAAMAIRAGLTSMDALRERV